jgi:hypothetical protein
MTKKALIARLETLLGDYKKRNREYLRASSTERRDMWRNAVMDANRYEGIATASRWAAEDLSELLREAKKT